MTTQEMLPTVTFDCIECEIEVTVNSAFALDLLPRALLTNFQIDGVGNLNGIDIIFG